MYGFGFRGYANIIPPRRGWCASYCGSFSLIRNFRHFLILEGLNTKTKIVFTRISHTPPPSQKYFPKNWLHIYLRTFNSVRQLIRSNLQKRLCLFELVYFSFLWRVHNIQMNRYFKKRLLYRKRTGIMDVKLHTLLSLTLTSEVFNFTLRWPRERALGSHWLGGWVSPIADPFSGIEPRSSISASHFTDWATLYRSALVIGQKSWLLLGTYAGMTLLLVQWIAYQ